MSAPFLIRHRDGREFELDDPEVYREVYMPQGFALVDPQPRGRDRPDLSIKRAATPRMAEKKRDEPTDD